MKKKNAPANKGNQLVSFTHQDAQRINATVAANERARRGRNPSSLPRAAGGGGGGAFATASFTGSWQKGSLKTITFSADTSQTAVASNIFATLAPHPSGAPLRCAVAAEGTTWILIASECS